MSITFDSSFSALFEILVLSITSYGRLKLASEPRDYDQILKRTIREVRFISEILLAILFVFETPSLVSQTLACLMLSLTIYVALESMTGDNLHTWIDKIPLIRIGFALLTKLPAVSVLWTVTALALNQPDSLATEIVLYFLALALLLGAVVRLKMHTLIRDAFRKVWKCVKEGVNSMTKMKISFRGGLGGRKRKSSDASVSSNATAVDEESMQDSEKHADSSSLSGDECV